MNCLLIGNGLNRCLKDNISISWGELLKGTAEKLKVNYNADIAMPLEYERIINAHLMENQGEKDDIYLKTKKNIAEMLSKVKLPQSSIHQKIAKLNVDAIMTTNYDCLLEYVYNSDYNINVKNVNYNTKYQFGETFNNEKIKIYHLHGVIPHVKTICLGYGHYVGILNQVRNQVRIKLNSKIQQILLEEKGKKNTWCELFYTSDIAILGFALTNCEIDIWWLLTHRAYLYYVLKAQNLNNKIVYYDIIDDNVKSDDEAKEKHNLNIAEQKNRHLLLYFQNVIVKTCNLSCFKNHTYEEAYEEILNDIEENGITDRCRDKITKFTPNNKAEIINACAFGEQE
jgi:hypothetical protein